MHVNVQATPQTPGPPTSLWQRACRPCKLLEQPRLQYQPPSTVFSTSMELPSSERGLEGGLNLNFPSETSREPTGPGSVTQGPLWCTQHRQCTAAADRCKPTARVLLGSRDFPGNGPELTANNLPLLCKHSFPSAISLSSLDSTASLI